MGLGCSRGYLLNSLLQNESFTAIGADVDEQEALSLWPNLLMASGFVSYGRRLAQSLSMIKA